MVNRLELPGRLEIMLNFGASVATAKANTAPQIIVMHRDSDDLKDSGAAHDPQRHGSGGDLCSHHRGRRQDRWQADSVGKSGMLIGFASDPVGNRLELIQQPQ